MQVFSLGFMAIKTYAFFFFHLVTTSSATSHNAAAALPTNTSKSNTPVPVIYKHINSHVLIKAATHTITVICCGPLTLCCFMVFGHFYRWVWDECVCVWTGARDGMDGRMEWRDEVRWWRRDEVDLWGEDVLERERDTHTVAESLYGVVHERVVVTWWCAGDLGVV